MARVMRTELPKRRPAGRLARLPLNGRFHQAELQTYRGYGEILANRLRTRSVRESLRRHPGNRNYGPQSVVGPSGRWLLTSASGVTRPGVLLLHDWPKGRVRGNKLATKPRTETLQTKSAAASCAVVAAPPKQHANHDVQRHKAGAGHPVIPEPIVLPWIATGQDFAPKLAWQAIKDAWKQIR